MKKTLLFLVIALLGIATAPATCWRINPSPYAGAQFKTVDEAMNDINVLPGDTLLLDPGKHGNFTITRKGITVIGSGYLLDKNKEWAESQASIIEVINLNGENCKVEGCDVTAYLYLYGKGCVASRCKVNSIYATNDNCIISQCFVTGGMNQANNTIARNNIIIGTSSGASGCIFENNSIVWHGDSYYGYYWPVANFSNSTIRNNIILCTRLGFDDNQIPYSTWIFSNCSNNVVQNNVLSTPEKYADSTIPHNLFVGATIENTFVNEGSEDAKWQLLDNSAAKGAATHGGDCGAFGGPTPYVLSGIPQFLPHITEALVPAKPTDGKITVKLKIANQNE